MVLFVNYPMFPMRSSMTELYRQLRFMILRPENLFADKTDPNNDRRIFILQFRSALPIVFARFVLICGL